MTGREIFNIWAPKGCKWVDWVRPVPFVAIGNGLKEYGIYNLMKNDVKYTSKASKSTAIIVDLPGYESVEEAIELAKQYSDDSVRKIINAVLDKVKED